jgi:hypothetical protein
MKALQSEPIVVAFRRLSQQARKVPSKRWSVHDPKYWEAQSIKQNLGIRNKAAEAKIGTIENKAFVPFVHVRSEK